MRIMSELEEGGEVYSSPDATFQKHPPRRNLILFHVSRLRTQAPIDKGKDLRKKKTLSGHLITSIVNVAFE